MTTLELATRYLNRGWQPLPIVLGSKNPGDVLGKGWQNFRTKADELPKHFGGRELNIGILLGAPSGNLVDIDLDTPFARKVAPAFLPPTEAIFGRASSPRSHYLYCCPDPDYQKYNNPVLVSPSTEIDRDRACIVEFRGKEGLQTIAPGSVHGASGERIEWAEDGDPAEVSTSELKKATGRVAAAALICEHWQVGVRNELAMALSGGLLRSGWERDEVLAFVHAICQATDDEETGLRLDTVRSTDETLIAGEPVTGFPTLAKLTDPKMVTALCKWLDIESRQAAEPARSDVDEVQATPFLGNGSDVLDDVYKFIGRFVSYPSEAAHVAHALWIGHTHRMDLWESTPRIAFLSPEPASGKSRALEVTEPLVPRAVHAVNTTPAYLFRKVSDAAGPPTILYDEIDTVFGPKAKENEDIRGMLNAGHRRGATAGRCVARGSIIETQELEAYCAVALAGLGNLPDTIMTRSVRLGMRRRSPNEKIEPWRMRKRAEARPIFESLQAWTATIDPISKWPEMPVGVEDRDADVWEPLLALADIAGGDWPERARASAVELVASSKENATSLGVQLLADLQTIFGDFDRLSTETIIDKLLTLPESTWADLRGKPLDARGLSSRLRPYQVKPGQVKIDGKNIRGYQRSDLIDPWSRYLPPSPANNDTSATSATPSETLGDSVADRQFLSATSADSTFTKNAHPAERGADKALRKTQLQQQTPENTGVVADVADVAVRSEDRSRSGCECGLAGPVGVPCFGCGKTNRSHVADGSNPENLPINAEEREAMRAGGWGSQVSVIGATADRGYVTCGCGQTAYFGSECFACATDPEG